MKRYYLIAVTSLIVIALYSCGGNATPPDSGGQPAAPSKPTGAELYNRTCVSCHQADGQGLPNVYPPLAKSDYILDKEKTIRQVITGSSGEITVNGKTFNNTMPPQQLNDEEVAAVLTYVYGNLGNAGGTVTPAEVKAVRDKK
jgi:nitrite reductase (NO-forming)